MTYKRVLIIKNTNKCKGDWFKPFVNPVNIQFNKTDRENNLVVTHTSDYHDFLTVEKVTFCVLVNIGNKV